MFLHVSDVIVNVPRPPRIEYPGATYHIMSRGVDRAKIFLDDRDRHCFLSKLGDIVAKGELLIHAFCLMATHYHLLAETPLAGLSRSMQLLLGDHGQRFNRRHRRMGHLFQGRYKALLVEDGDYFLECSRYIHLNPNRAEISRPAELYPWSSYRNYVGGPCVVDWVATGRTLGFFHGPGHYRAFVEAGRDGPPVSPFERAKAGFVLGGEAFVENIRKLLGETSHRDSEATLRALSRTLAHPSVPEVQDAVRSVFGDRSDCQKRRLEMFALRLFAGLPVRDVGLAVGVTANAVSKAHKAIRVQLAKDSELERRLRLLAGRFQSATALASAPPHDEAPALIRRGVPGTIHG